MPTDAQCGLFDAPHEPPEIPPPRVDWPTLQYGFGAVPPLTKEQKRGYENSFLLGKTQRERRRMIASGELADLVGEACKAYYHQTDWDRRDLWIVIDTATRPPEIFPVVRIGESASPITEAYCADYAPLALVDAFAHEGARLVHGHDLTEDERALRDRIWHTPVPGSRKSRTWFEELRIRVYYCGGGGVAT